MSRPLSMQGRLLVVAALTTIAALTITGVMVQRALVHVVSENLNARVDTQILLIERAVGSDGRLKPGGIQFFDDLDLAKTQWGWRLQTSSGRWSGGMSFGRIHFHDGDSEARNGIVSGISKSGAGADVHVRVKQANGRNIDVAVPRELLMTNVRPSVRSVRLALLSLAAVLVLATWAQLRFGMQPLHSLSEEIEKIRNGDACSIDTDQPVELVLLVQQLNALIAQNAAGLAYARKHVANLAHGLKTPLATLALTLARERASGKTQALVGEMNMRISHHLARARMAAANSGERARADVAEVASALIVTMNHLYRDRGIHIAMSVSDMLVIGTDRQDLSEMIGNLLENACRYAERQVKFGATRSDGRARLLIEDDGPGIPAQAMHHALQAGSRLDEHGQGFGFGLSIVNELSKMYGGSLVLTRSSDLGGLCAELILPAR